MKTQLLIVGMILGSAIYGQIQVPKITLQPDGFPDSTEWDPVDIQAIISRGLIENTTLQVAYDDSVLYVRFNGNLESSFLFPEVLIDTDLGRDSSWAADDHWFHVSATDCHSIGVYGDYNTCVTTATDWAGGPNMATSLNADDIEFVIPWNTLGITPSQGDTIGFLPLVTNANNEWNTWPPGIDHMVPAEWGYIYLSGPLSERELNFPALRWTRSDAQTIRISNLPINADWQVYDLGGRLLFNGTSNGEQIDLNLSEGQMYVLSVMKEEKSRSIKMR